LGFESQKRQRYQFLLMLAFSAVVFGAFSFRGLAMAPRLMGQRVMGGKVPVKSKDFCS
jgi:hypothetical protein